MATATSLPKPPFDLEAALREVGKGYELASELHSLLREVIPRGDGRLESAFRLSKDVQQTLASALTILTPRRAKFRASLDPLALEISLPPSTDCPSRESRASTVTADPAKVTQTEQDNNNNNNTNHKNPKKRNLESATTITYETCHDGLCCKTNEEKKINKAKVQRNHLHSWTTNTCTPFNDGYQWRKYGEKKISQCAMPRCYYRCTHKDDQGCPATKQVQQKDTEDPPTFIVTYNKQHTCKNRNLLYGEQFVIKPAITDPCQLSL